MTDPRFDPAFQRGYSGPEPELVARQPVPAADGPERGTDTARGVTATDPTLEPTPVPTQTPPADDASVYDGTDVIRNPWRMSLLALGVILLLAAVATLYSQIQQPQATDATPLSQFVHLLVGDLTPSLTVAGFVCVILWLALGALDRVEPN